MRSKKAASRRLKRAQECVVGAFATHWRKILRSRKDMVKERVGCFFAGSALARKRLAHNYYGREHVRQMAGLSTAEIREMLSPWLEPAARYWIDDFGLLKKNFLSELPTAEYVSVICLHHSGVLLIDRYPGGRVLYDDLYERMLGGYSTGGVLRIYKSTGERFTPFEARSVRAGIRRDLLSGIRSTGDDDPWTFNMNGEGCMEALETPGFEEEDFNRVVIVEVNDWSERENSN